MATLSDSMVSSSARKLAMRMRPDLSARRQRYQGRVYWVLKDPVGLNYFRFQEEEYAILKMLDGQTSLDKIKDRFEAEFPPQKITVEELQQFLGMLHKSGLVIADVPGQGRQLKKRRDERKRKERLAAATNILSIRFKGIDPDRILNRIYPWVAWVFHPVTMFLWAVVALSALTLVFAQFDVFQSKLPAFHQCFNVKNAMWLAVVLGATKVLHEFGHGLSCKHYGGECHEMGVMILVLTPCLYCNVSDSWMLPSKWKRAFIGFAGMYVEIFIASVCTFMWWFSEPGMLNHLCLSTMFVCSVSTIMFNGNPLLRYDGYYILADLVEIPNMRQKATSILSRKLGHWCLGIEPPDDPFLPERNQMFFALYTVASACYRWFVVLSILLFLYRVFEPYGLKIICQGIAAMSMYGLFIQPLYKLVKFFYVPGRVDKVKKPRMYATLGLLGTVVALIVFLPLPHRVHCTLEIKPLDAKGVYVVVPGTLGQPLVEPGDRVVDESGGPLRHVLARLTNVDLEIAVSELQGAVNSLEVEFTSLWNQRNFGDDDAADQIPEVKKSLEAAKEQLKRRQEDLARLVLVAPIAGTVLPAPLVPKRPSPDGQLPIWSGSPLDARNSNALLQEGTLLCYVGDPKRKKAVLVVDQADIDFLTQPYKDEDGQIVGDRVEIMLDQYAGRIIRGMISEIASDKIAAASRQLTNKAGGELATQTDEAGVERLQSTSYEAVVELDDPDELLKIGMRGQAKIHVGWQPLGKRIMRFVFQTFHFKL